MKLTPIGTFLLAVLFFMNCRDASYVQRKALFDEMQPIALKNCHIEKIGKKINEGYLMCDNLFTEAKAAYSYGIEGKDAWGCEISQKLGLSVHEYDCFDSTKPTCANGKLIFHNECIDAQKKVEKKRVYDSLTNQINRNGDSGKRLIVKIDVEGAEWDSLEATPDSVLENIDQLAMEMHKVDNPKYISIIRKLKKHFYFVHLHINNYACTKETAPFPGWAFQVLLVNKRIGIPDMNQKVTLPHPLDTPDNADAPDCPVKK